MIEFTENWFSPASCIVLATLVERISDVPGRIIEIGSWEGRSTIVLATATDREVHAVDTWKGCDSDATGERAARRDVHARFQQNIVAANATNVVEHWMDWRAYRDVDDTPVALLFIDAEHTYAEVTAQIDAFRPLMSAGGIICGDDRTHPPVWSAVTDRFPDANAEHAVWWTVVKES